MKVYCNGAFDLFHAGHVKYLNIVSQLGDLHVGVHSDVDMKSYKRTPVVPYEERCVMVENCKCVSGVIKGTKLSISESFIRFNNIDIVVCAEYQPEYHSDPQKMGILKVVPRAKAFMTESTTDLIKKIKAKPFYEAVPDETVLHKRYITVWSRLRTINGLSVMFDVVGRQGPYPNCVCIFPYDSKRKIVYMIKEYHQGTDEIKWGLPAGYYEPKKHRSIQYAAECELSEERKMKGGHWVNLLPAGYSELKWVTNKVVPFLCLDPIIDECPKKCDVEENCERVTIPVTELMVLIRSGKITLTSLMTIVLALDYLKVLQIT